MSKFCIYSDNDRTKLKSSFALFSYQFFLNSGQGFAKNNPCQYILQGFHSHFHCKVINDKISNYRWPSHAIFVIHAHILYSVDGESGQRFYRLHIQKAVINVIDFYQTGAVITLVIRFNGDNPKDHL